MPSEIHARRLLIALVLAALALTALLVRPFWVALFVAAVLAAALRSPMEALSRLCRGRRAIAATLLTLAVVVAVILPVAGLGAFLVNQVVDGVQWLRGELRSEGVWGLLERLPAPAREAAQGVLRAIPEPHQQLQQLAGARSGQAAAAVVGGLAATGSVLLQAAMMLVALFFFLTDGRRLIHWIDARVPLRPGQLRALLEDFRQTSVSVLVATLGTAAFQSLAALVGYLIARAPNVPFLTLVTFLVALVPALGGALVVVGVAVLLMTTGHLVAGLFLAAWGVVVVSLSDNLARPYLLKGRMELHGGLVFFALIGGLAAFGWIGLLVGPLILTFLVAVLKLYRSEFASDPPRPPPGASP